MVHGRGLRRAARAARAAARPTASPPASSRPVGAYDRVVAISRSGTTTEVVRAIEATGVTRRRDHGGARQPGGGGRPTTRRARLRRRAVGRADGVRHDGADAAARLARASRSSRVIAQADGGARPAPRRYPAELEHGRPGHLPRPGLGLRHRAGGRAEDARGRPAVDRGLPADGVPPRPDLDRPARPRGLGLRPPGRRASPATSPRPARRWSTTTSTRSPTWCGPSCSPCAGPRPQRPRPGPAASPDPLGRAGRRAAARRDRHARASWSSRPAARAGGRGGQRHHPRARRGDRRGRRGQRGPPVILQISENAVRFHGGQLEPIAAATRRGRPAAARCRSPCTSTTSPTTSCSPQATGSVFSSVMYDAGALPYDENVERTRAAAELAHARRPLGRGRAGLRRRQGRRAAERARAGCAHRPRRGRGVRRGHRRRRPGGGGRQLARDDDADRPARRRPDRAGCASGSTCRWCCTARPACPPTSCAGPSRPASPRSTSARRSTSR